MKKNLHILLLFISIMMVGITARPQGGNPYDLPMACSNTLEEYWVKGFNGSTFEWRILNASGQEVDVDITHVNDTTVLVNWSSDLIGGIYTFEVIEHTMFDCIGEPYTQDIVLNTSDYIEIPLENVTDFFQVCIGDEKDLEPGNFQNYLWTINNSSSPIYTTGEAGTYEVRLVDHTSNCAYHPITLHVNPLPEVFLGPDTFLFGAQTLLLDAYSSYRDSIYQWESYNFQNNAWSEIAIAYNSPTYLAEGGYGDQWIATYVTDFNGCSNSDSILIRAENYTNLNVPRAFTPNGDGVNDTWMVPVEELIQQGISVNDPWTYLQNLEVAIYNRWGKMVWYSKGPYREWDGRDLGGRDLPMDSYHYIITITVDGKKFPPYKGSVTILR